MLSNGPLFVKLGQALGGEVKVRYVTAQIHRPWRYRESPRYHVYRVTGAHRQLCEIIRPVRSGPRREHASVRPGGGHDRVPNAAASRRDHPSRKVRTHRHFEEYRIVIRDRPTERHAVPAEGPVERVPYVLDL